MDFYEHPERTKFKMKYKRNCRSWREYSKELKKEAWDNMGKKKKKTLSCKVLKTKGGEDLRSLFGWWCKKKTGPSKMPWSETMKKATDHFWNNEKSLKKYYDFLKFSYIKCNKLLTSYNGMVCKTIHHLLVFLRNVFKSSSSFLTQNQLL